MAPASFLHILSVVSLAVLHVSFGALPVNALALERNHAARGLGHAHADIAKRADSKKCRPRPSSVSPNAGAVATSPVPSPQSSQPAPTTTSSQSPPANTPSSSDGNGSKILIGWSNLEETSLKNFVPKGSAPALFNWDISYANAQEVFGPSYAAFQTLEYVPSVSSANAHLLAGVLKGSNIRHCRTFNEVDIVGQDTMSPETGHSLWMQYIEPAINANPNVVVFAPTVTGSDGGIAWLASFNKLCNGGCSFKKLDLHFYTTDIKGVIPILEQMHTTYQMNIWITEFGCHDYYDADGHTVCTQEVFNTLYNAIMPYVMDSSFVEKLGWFGFFRKNEIPGQLEAVNSFMNCDSSSPDCGPNDVGSKFINGVTSI